MIDPPIESHLLFLLQSTSSVSTEDLCWWDSRRAERVLRAAAMIQYAPGLWRTHPLTAAWLQETFDEIRSCRPAELDGTDEIFAGFDIDAVETAPASKAPPAPAAARGTRAPQGGEGGADPTPTKHTRHVA